MALSILDGTQTATTLSTILSSGQHITAHTVVSLGTQAKTDILSAVSSGIAISGTVTVGNSVNINSLPSIRINPNYNGQDGNNGPVVEADSDIGSDPRYMVLAGGYDGVNSEFRALTFITGGLAVAGTVTVGSALPAGTNRIGVVTIGAGTVTIGAGTAQIGSVTASISGTVPISGTVTANAGDTSFFVSGLDVYAHRSVLYSSSGNGFVNDDGRPVDINNPLPISGTVTVGNTVTIAGTVTANPTGTQTIAGSVTIGAGTAQIGSVTASISNSVTIASFTTSVTARLINPAGTAVTYAEVGTAGSPSIDVLSVQGVTAGSPVITTLLLSSTAISSGSFTSLASATLVPGNTARKMATVYNLGAGQLFVNAGSSATTLGGGFMVALNSGDFYECNYTTTTLSAIFATAGTASWVSH